MSPDPPDEVSTDSLEGAVVILTERCNSRCGMCDYWKYAAPRSLSAGQVENFWERRVRQVPHFVTLSGGEPLLYPELFRLAGFFRGRAAHLVLSTNGLLLGDHAETVATHFDKVIVSLDGASPDSYAKVRGVDGFQAVTDSAAALKALGGGKVNLVLKMTIQKDNFRDLPEWIPLALGLGADGVALAVPDMTSDAFLRPGADRLRRAEKVMLSEDEASEFASLVDRVAREFQDLLAGGFVIEGNLPAFVEFFRRNARPAAAPSSSCFPRDCLMARKRLILNADGSIRPCFFLPPLAQIQDPGEGDIFDSVAFRSFRCGFSSRLRSECRACYQFLDWRFQ